MGARAGTSQLHCWGNTELCGPLLLCGMSPLVAWGLCQGGRVYILQQRWGLCSGPFALCVAPALSGQPGMSTEPALYFRCPQCALSTAKMQPWIFCA